MHFDHAALFGEHFLEPGVYAMRGLASRDVWCAMSLGGRAVSARKAGEAVPNEDALCVAEHGAGALLAVADGHFGHAASHAIIARLDRALEARANETRGESDVLPRHLDDLYALVATCADPAPHAGRGARDSETTLVVALLDRSSREVWGVSVGDSSAVLLGLGTRPRWLTRATRTFAAPADPATLAPARMIAFRAPVTPGELVVVFTDGVNECEYGSPETSIGLRHMQSLMIRAAGHPERFVDLLAQLALSGVDGHPGGEDNLALAAARV
jgi:hypothetical protein